MRENKGSNAYSNNPSCCFEPFISPNPITSYNPIQHYPTIDQTAFVSQFTSVIGDVTLRNNVYVAPNVTIRADEGTPFYIGSHTNIQDRVILHGLANKKISVEGRKFSIFIGNEVSIAHGALIHGPCYIADKVFVGFNAIVYTAIVGSGAFISYNAVVTTVSQFLQIHLCHLEQLLILKKKLTHYLRYLVIVMNLLLQFNKSIRNYPHLITC
ncbi:hypothetical protein [Gottfriedia sp. OAE603]|uniref:hypothetical protein n=1 Tax=Gottfriedia sp. OAE603 TaxID=2663872 RepID=UPI001A087CD3